MAKVTIYLGQYGSGKTELSLAKAFSLSEKGVEVTLVDLDIVNPYFRAGEKKQELKARGINVIMPNFEGTTVAVPSLPAAVNSVFTNDKSFAVVDVGGSPSGATVLGRYRNDIINEDYDTILVVNTMRPFTSSSGEIVDMARQIEDKSRLKIKSVINNTNAAYSTTPDMLEGSQAEVEKAAKELGAQVIAIYALQSVIDGLTQGFKEKYSGIIAPIELKMRPSWMDEQPI